MTHSGWAMPSDEDDDIPANCSLIPDFIVKDARLWFYRAFIARVVDGDTVIAVLDRGLQDFKVLKLRLAGVDAPELRPRDGTLEQRNIERALAERAKQRLIVLINQREVIVQLHKTRKRDRWLASVFLPSSFERTANQTLLDEKLAVRYGEQRPWRL